MAPKLRISFVLVLAWFLSPIGSLSEISAHLYNGFARFFAADLSRGVPESHNTTQIRIKAVYEMRDEDSEMRDEG